MKKRLITGILTVFMLGTMITGCGSNTINSSTTVIESEGTVEEMSEDVTEETSSQEVQNTEIAQVSEVEGPASISRC